MSTDDLHDPALRRALDHAPDQAAAPDPRTRAAIVKAAYDAVARPRPAAGAGAAPWWHRLWGGGPGARLPWNAAFATVLVAVLVTVLWHREPVPDATLDREAPAVAPERAQAPPEPAPAPQAAPAAPEAQTAREAPPPEARRREAPPPRKAQPPAVPAPAAPDAAGAAASSVPPPAPAQEPAATADLAPPQPPSPAPSARLEAAPPAALARPDAAAAPRAATAARPPAPDFSALARWTDLEAARDGPGVRRARDEVEGMPALLEAVVRSATARDAALAAPVDLRVTLQRDGAPLAVLEIAGDQVRWRPRPGAAPWTGTPPAAALAALRRQLQ